MAEDEESVAVRDIGKHFPLHDWHPTLHVASAVMGDGISGFGYLDSDLRGLAFRRQKSKGPTTMRLPFSPDITGN